MAISSIYEEDYGIDLEDMYGRRFKRLKDVTERISELDNSRFRNLNPVRYEIAMGLYIVDRDKLYLDSPNYPDFYAYAKDVLGYQKAMANTYVRIAKKFIDKKRPTTVFGDGQTDFNMAQLRQLLYFSVEDVNAMLNAGTISFDTPAEAIKEIVDDRKAAAKQANLFEAMEALKPLEESWEAYHSAYQAVKDHLNDVGDTIAANELLPKIMDAAVSLYEAGRKQVKDGKK